jgi:phosphoglycolate phosphatase
MQYEYILFDLDGTLTDPALGITNSVMHALKKYNIQVRDRSELYKFIGPPLTESFEKYCGFSQSEAVKAVEYYREYYKDTGIYENKVYEGIRELLELLKSKGKTLVLATSKPEIFAKQILEHFELAKYFSFISGSCLDGTRVKKDEVIQYALENCNIADKSSVVMVGDREHDVLGAKKCGVQCIGVLFGYGGKEELEAAGADYLAASVEEIGKIVLQ